MYILSAFSRAGTSLRILKIRVKHVAVAIIQSTDITRFEFARLAHILCICSRTDMYYMYSQLPHNPYPSVDCSGYGVLGSMDSKKGQNKGQTNKILFKNPEKRSEDRYTMLLLLRLPECVTMRLESLSRRLNIIFFYCFCNQQWDTKFSQV